MSNFQLQLCGVGGTQTQIQTARSLNVAPDVMEYRIWGQFLQANGSRWLFVPSMGDGQPCDAAVIQAWLGPGSPCSLLYIRNLDGNLDLVVKLGKGGNAEEVSMVAGIEIPPGELQEPPSGLLVGMLLVNMTFTLSKYFLKWHAKRSVKCYRYCMFAEKEQGLETESEHIANVQGFQALFAQQQQQQKQQRKELPPAVSAHPK